MCNNGTVWFKHVARLISKNTRLPTTGSLHAMWIQLCCLYFHSFMPIIARVLHHFCGSVIFLTTYFPQQYLRKLGRSRLKIWMKFVESILVHPQIELPAFRMIFWPRWGPKMRPKMTKNTMKKAVNYVFSARERLTRRSLSADVSACNFVPLKLPQTGQIS